MSEEKVVVNQTPVENKGKKAKKPKSKPRIIIEWVALGLFALLFGFVIAGNISAMATKKENNNQELRFGVGTFVVLTKSMEPRFKKDDALFTYKEKLSKVYKDYQNGKTINMTFFNKSSGKSIVPETEEFQPIHGGEVVVTDMVMTHEVKEMYYDPSVPYGQGQYIIITAGINPDVETSQKGQYQIVTENLYLGVVKWDSLFVGHVFKFIASPVGLIILLLVPAGYLIITSGIDIFKVLKETEEKEAAVTTTGDPKDIKVDNLSEEEKKRLKEELLSELLAEKQQGKEENKSEEK